MASLLDMSQIPLPATVEELDYSVLRSAWLTDYAAREDVSVSDLDDNDPIVHGLETGAYRELLIRQRINDAVRGVLLASSWGQRLDDLGADPLYGNTPRLTLDPGDPDAVPPIPPVYESDADYKARLALAPNALSVAGPEGAYKIRALSAHADAVDVAVTSPTASNVLVEVLHDSSDPLILSTIADALSASTVRPIGDRVTVVAATKEPSTLDLTVRVADGPDLAVVEAEAQARIDLLVQPIARQVRSGSLLSESGSDLWKGCCLVPGVLSVEETASTGLSDTDAAWWPLTITVTALRTGG